MGESHWLCRNFLYSAFIPRKILPKWVFNSQKSQVSPVCGSLNSALFISTDHKTLAADNYGILFAFNLNFFSISHLKKFLI